MKKLLLILCLLALPCLAEEVTKQDIEIENAGGIAIIQKQPINANQFQVIKIKKSGGLLLIQINGKVKDEATNKVD
jgi:hypothetical protein